MMISLSVINSIEVNCRLKLIYNKTSRLSHQAWLGLSGALLDRLTHRVHIIEMQGESYRLKKSKKQKEREKTTKTKS
jgi:DNA replication protein DnaC